METSQYQPIAKKTNLMDSRHLSSLLGLISCLGEKNFNPAHAAIEQQHKARLVSSLQTTGYDGSKTALTFSWFDIPGKWPNRSGFNYHFLLWDL